MQRCEYDKRIMLRLPSTPELWHDTLIDWLIMTFTHAENVGVENVELKIAGLIITRWRAKMQYCKIRDGKCGNGIYRPGILICTPIKHQRKWGCVWDRSTGPMQTMCACCADVITEMGTVVHFAAFPDTWCCKVVFLQLSELKRSVAFIQLRRLNCDKCRNTTLHRFRFHNCYCF